MSDNEFWAILTQQDIQLIARAIDSCIGIEGCDAIIADLRILRKRVYGALEHPRTTGDGGQFVDVSE